MLFVSKGESYSQLPSAFAQTCASWAGYNASKSSFPRHHEPAIISFLPTVFWKCSFVGYDSSFHELFKSAVEHITPSQIPAIAVDQPLIPLAGQTLWTLGEMYNADQYFIMLGGLLIKMAALKLLGLVY